MKKQKYYVVWVGVTPGIYDSWTDCQLQINGYKGARYKAFSTREEAEEAYADSPEAYIGRAAAGVCPKRKPALPADVPLNDCLAKTCRPIA